MKRFTNFLTVLFVAVAAMMYSCGPQVDDPALAEELAMYKKMTPMQIKQMKDNCDAKLANAEQLKEDAKMAQSHVDSIQRLYNAATAKLKMASQSIEDAKEEVEMSKLGIKKGYEFKVQIGAFKKLKLDDPNAGEGFSLMKENGMSKYFVGSFNNFKEADDFRKEVRLLGIKDAFVVAFKDGVKMDLEKAKAATAKKK